MLRYAHAIWKNKLVESVSVVSKEFESRSKVGNWNVEATLLNVEVKLRVEWMWGLGTNARGHAHMKSLVDPCIHFLCIHQSTQVHGTGTYRTNIVYLQSGT